MQHDSLKSSNQGIACVILNRPVQQTAFDDGMIAEWVESRSKLEQDDTDPFLENRTGLDRRNV